MAGARMRWRVLTMAGLAQLMVVLDPTVITSAAVLLLLAAATVALVMPRPARSTSSHAQPDGLTPTTHNRS